MVTITRKVKLYVVALLLLSVFSLTACNKDEETFNSSNLAGTWLRVYDKSVISDGFVHYTFIPEDAVAGKCDIFCYDVFAGDTTYHRLYWLDNEKRRLTIFEPSYGDASSTDSLIWPTQIWDIQQLTTKKMTCIIADSDIILHFEKGTWK